MSEQVFDLILTSGYDMDVDIDEDIVNTVIDEAKLLKNLTYDTFQTNEEVDSNVNNNNITDDIIQSDSDSDSDNNEPSINQNIATDNINETDLINLENQERKQFLVKGGVNESVHYVNSNVKDDFDVAKVYKVNKDLDMQIFGNVRVYLSKFIDQWNFSKELYSKSMSFQYILSIVVKIAQLDPAKFTKLKLINFEDCDYYEKRSNLDHIIEKLDNLYRSDIKAHILLQLKKSSSVDTHSLLMRELFFSIVKYFERCVEAYVKLRNVNNWRNLVHNWIILNEHADSSSIILSNFADSIDLSTIKATARKKLTNFVYKGFCRHAPAVRLLQLLEFPQTILTKEIEQMKPNFVPDEQQIKENFSSLFKISKQKHIKIAPYNYKNMPFNAADSINDKKNIIIWYINEIVELHKHILPLAESAETFILNHNDIIKESIVVFKQLTSPFINSDFFDNDIDLT